MQQMFPQSFLFRVIEAFCEPEQRGADINPKGDETSRSEPKNDVCQFHLSIPFFWRPVPFTNQEG